MGHKFSIITPAYNSFNLMDKYFKSFLAQTFKDFELIIVDDCSSDKTYDLLLEQAKDMEIDVKVFKTPKNSGPGTARNIGIDHSSGEWITFIDNDDWVDIDFLEKINNVIEKEKTDCVIYDFYIVSGDKKTTAKSVYSDVSGEMDVNTAIRYVRNHAIGKVYRHECVKDLRYPTDLRRCEDVAYVARALARCKKIYYYAEPLYYYFQRKGSLSNNKSLDERDMVKAFEYLEKELDKNYHAELEEKSITDLLYGGVLMMFKAKKDKAYIKEYISNYEKKYPDWFKCEIITKIGFYKKTFLRFVKRRNMAGLKLLVFIHNLMLK